MIGICTKCGNHAWDKNVEGDTVICPRCGNRWGFRKLPLLILTGCSGVGKTTTAAEMIRRNVDFAVLDADMFYNIMPHETEKDYYRQVEQMESLSRNVTQTGKPVLWTMAGNLDKLHKAYNSRFFSAIHCLALVCGEEELRRRMREGRGITDETWIQSSVEYNEYFQSHSRIEETSFETCDISGKTPAEAADAVIAWVAAKREPDIVFRKGTREDTAAIMALVKTAVAHMEAQGIFQWDDLYPTAEDFEADIDEGALYVGVTGNQIAVAATWNRSCDDEYGNGAWRFPQKPFAVVHRLCVHAAFQNKGIARKMMAYIEAVAKTQGMEAVRLDVYRENPHARRLYEKRGYVQTGEAHWRKGTFLLMEKYL